RNFARRPRSTGPFSYPHKPASFTRPSWPAHRSHPDTSGGVILMRMSWMRLLLAFICLLPGGAAMAGENRVDQILERFEQANRWRDHVMIVAHRAGGLRAGKTLYPENSLAALRASIADGAE